MRDSLEGNRDQEILRQKQNCPYFVERIALTPSEQFARTPSVFLNPALRLDQRDTLMLISVLGDRSALTPSLSRADPSMSQWLWPGSSQSRPHASSTI